MTKPLILHLSVDYPNHYLRENTLAVRNFIEANSVDINHFVIALTRTSNPFKVGHIDGDGNGAENVVSMCYWGLPFGIFLRFSMKLVANRINLVICKKKLKPNLVHAHKLTFEGIAAWYLSRKFDLPLVVSVRGESESKVLRYKPHYHFLLKSIIDYALCIYYVSAWFKPLLNEKFTIPAQKQYLLPNFIKSYVLPQNQNLKPQTYTTILDLNVYKKKGLDRLLPAFKRCLQKWPELHLDIIGRSNPDALREVQKLIEKFSLEQNVTLVGSISNENLLTKLSTYSGLLLPSHNETFGMVFVEALIAGVPILHSRDTGIDGFVDCVESRVAVNPNSIDEIYDGICFLINNFDDHKKWLLENKTLITNLFRKEKYIRHYSELCLALTS